MFFSEDFAIDRVMAAQAAGATDVNGDGLSLDGFDGICYIAVLGTLTATQVTQLKAQQSDDDGSADAYTDIEGSQTDAMADADSNKLLVLDIYRPEEEFVRPVVERATANAVIDAVIAIRYRSKELPITQSSDVSQLKQIADAVAGTA